MTDDVPITRMERLLALLLLHNLAEASQVEKSVMLSRAGFSNPQIADLLGTSVQTVAQNLYSARKLRAGKRTAKAPKDAGKKRARPPASARKRGSTT